MFPVTMLQSQNKPNFKTPRIERRKYAKRTQSRPTGHGSRETKICKTNPISPNGSRATGHERRKHAKQTQFCDTASRVTGHERRKNEKRTQSRPTAHGSRVTRDENMQNEPNSSNEPRATNYPLDPKPQNLKINSKTFIPGSRSLTGENHKTNLSKH